MDGWMDEWWEKCMENNDMKTWSKKITEMVKSTNFKTLRHVMLHSCDIGNVYFDVTYHAKHEWVVYKNIHLYYLFTYCSLSFLSNLRENLWDELWGICENVFKVNKTKDMNYLILHHYLSVFWDVWVNLSVDTKFFKINCRIRMNDYYFSVIWIYLAFKMFS